MMLLDDAAIQLGYSISADTISADTMDDDHTIHYEVRLGMRTATSIPA
uniref:Uncharacterized protein n=1 Tax=Picea glauca TaxID=3330 RepID=A0A117NHW7_PICGL|nr:hypothetical protein ABT39_MTgene4379 [Picea glauca]KUM50216.1 hypothetical protein ABT39_MTgene59 [Picea glauca]QHR90775.1 hypothetical protein Q903MT_gene4801 [Picea sitchensis]